MGAYVVAIGYINGKPIDCYYLLADPSDGFVPPSIHDIHGGILVRADSVRIVLPIEDGPRELIQYELPHKSRDAYCMESIERLTPIDPAKWIRERQRTIDTAQQIKKRSDKGQKQYGVAAGPAPQLRQPFRWLVKIFRRFIYK